MKLNESEETMLAYVSSALFYLREKEPSLYSQSMARQYVEDVQKILLEKQKQKPLDASGVA